MAVRRFWLLGFAVLLFIGGIAFWSAVFDGNFLARPNRIGVVEVEGLIEDTQDNVKAMKEFRENDNVRAIVLRVNSPGGGVGASQELCQEVRRTVPDKPVVASLGGVAASGGYYIASAASHIVANPGTITGSIGVIMAFPNLRGLFDKIGYDTITIKAGKFKDVGNPGREMTPEERAYMQSTIDEAHRQFIRDVAQGRKLSEEKVREVADGRIIMGETARGLNLVDQLGNFEDAVKAATELGKIEGKPELVYARKHKDALLDYLLGGRATSRLNAVLSGSWNFLRYQLPVLP